MTVDDTISTSFSKKYSRRSSSISTPSELSGWHISGSFLSKFDANHFSLPSRDGALFIEGSLSIGKGCQYSHVYIGNISSSLQAFCCSSPALASTLHISRNVWEMWSLPLPSSRIPTPLNGKRARRLNNEDRNQPSIFHAGRSSRLLTLFFI